MPLPMETFMALVSSIVPSCHQISPLATFYCCLSDRKTFTENPFISSYRLYRHLFILSPFAMRLFSSLSLLLLHSLPKAFSLSPIISVDTTLLRRNKVKLPFVKRAYDPLQKRGAVGQGLAIACCSIGKLCLPVGFLIREQNRRGFIFAFLSFSSS